MGQYGGIFPLCMLLLLCGGVCGYAAAIFSNLAGEQ